MNARTKYLTSTVTYGLAILESLPARATIAPCSLSREALSKLLKSGGLLLVTLGALHLAKITLLFLNLQGETGSHQTASTTIFNDLSGAFVFDRSRMFIFSSRISLVNRWSNWVAHLVRDGGSEVQILPLRPTLSSIANLIRHSIRHSLPERTENWLPQGG
jgi:hypothetical protein